MLTRRDFCRNSLLGLATASIGRTANADKPLPYEKKYTFSYTPMKRQPIPLLHPTINGRSIANLIVDTGAPRSMLTSGFVDRLEINRKALIVHGDPKQEGLTGEYVVVDNIDLQTFVFAQVPFFVASDNRLTKIADQQIDGILGIDYLQHFPFEFDFIHHTMSVFLTGQISEQEAQAMGYYKSRSIPLVPSDPIDGLFPAKTNSTYTIEARLESGGNKVTETLRIDTGSPVTIIAAGTAEKLKLHPLSKLEIRQYDDMHAQFAVARVEKMHLGEIIVSNDPVCYPLAGSQSPSLLGLDVMAQGAVLMDFIGNRLYFKRASPLAP